MKMAGNLFLKLEDWWEKVRRRLDQRARRSRRAILRWGAESWSWPWLLASHGRDSKQKQVTAVTPKITAVTPLLTAQKVRSARADFGAFLWTFGGTFGMTFVRVFTTCKGYKYPILFTSWTPFRLFLHYIFRLGLEEHNFSFSISLKRSKGKGWRKEGGHFKAWGFISRTS